MTSSLASDTTDQPAASTAVADNTTPSSTRPTNLWASLYKDYGRPFRRIAKALYLFQRGAINAFQQPEFRRKFYYALLAQLILHVLLSFLSYLLILGPLNVIHFLLGGKTTSDETEPTTITKILNATSTTVQDWIEQVPLVMVLSLRYVFWKIPDSIFMSSLQRRNPPLYANLNRLPYQYHYLDEFKHSLKRTWKRLRWLLGLRIAQAIPYVGEVATFAATFMMTRYSFGRKLAILNAIIILFVPNGQALAVLLMNTVLGSRQFVRELMDPFFCRIDMNAHMRREWFRQHNAATFGFGVLAYLAIQLPWTNLLVFLIAQSAIVELISTPKLESKRQ
jgi:hypothetical protein